MPIIFSIPKYFLNKELFEIFFPSKKTQHVIESIMLQFTRTYVQSMLPAKIITLHNLSGVLNKRTCLNSFYFVCHVKAILEIHEISFENIE